MVNERYLEVVKGSLVGSLRDAWWILNSEGLGFPLRVVDFRCVMQVLDSDRHGMVAVNGCGVVLHFIRGRWVSVETASPSMVNGQGSMVDVGAAPRPTKEQLKALDKVSKDVVQGQCCSEWGKVVMATDAGRELVGAVDRFVEVMIDIETLATVADAVVTEIGAVMFDGVSGEILDEFSYECDVDAQLRDGRRASASTLRWYQDNGLKMSGLEGGETMYLGNVMSLLNEWVTTFCKRQDINLDNLKVWAKGGMDCAVLDHAVAEMGYELPWSYWQVRDMRTVMNESGVVVEKMDVPHEGLADCKIQVKQLMAVRSFVGQVGIMDGAERDALAGVMAECEDFKSKNLG